MNVNSSWKFGSWQGGSLSIANRMVEIMTHETWVPNYSKTHCTDNEDRQRSSVWSEMSYSDNMLDRSKDSSVTCFILL